MEKMGYGMKDWLDTYDPEASKILYAVTKCVGCYMFDERKPWLDFVKDCLKCGVTDFVINDQSGRNYNNLDMYLHEYSQELQQTPVSPIISGHLPLEPDEDPFVRQEEEQ